MLIVDFPCRSVNEYLALLARKRHPGRLPCPFCHTLMTPWGSYTRKAQEQTIYRVRVYRQRCPSCQKTHALLPAFLVPYSPHPAAIQETALRATVLDGQTIEQTAERFGIAPRTLQRWRQKLAPHVASISGWFAAQLATQLPWVRQWHKPVTESFTARLRPLFDLGDLCFRSRPHLVRHGVLALFYRHGPAAVKRQLFRCLA